MSFWPRQLDRAADGRAAVGDDQQVLVAALAGRQRARGDLLRDRGRVLGARVVRGDDHDARVLRRGGAHHRPLGDVARPG